MSSRSCQFALIIPLVVIALPGCLVPYCSPTICHVHPCDVGCETSEVHAFRLDVTKRDVAEGKNTERYLLTPVTLSETGTTPALKKVSHSYGLYAVSPVSTTGIMMETSFLVALRLYRPGHELVEV